MKRDQLVRCIDVGPFTRALTEGKEYVVRSVVGTSGDLIRVVQDDGRLGAYYKTRFELVDGSPRPMPPRSAHQPTERSRPMFQKGQRVKCVEPRNGLTVDRVYTVVACDSEFTKVRGDCGSMRRYFHGRFEAVEDGGALSPAKRTAHNARATLDRWEGDVSSIIPELCDLRQQMSFDPESWRMLGRAIESLEQAARDVAEAGEFIAVRAELNPQANPGR